MGSSAYAIVTTLLALLGLVGLLSLRLFGLYSHQALALVLLLGCGWAVASRVWLARKGACIGAATRIAWARRPAPVPPGDGTWELLGDDRHRVPGGLSSVGGNDTTDRRPDRRFLASGCSFVPRLAQDQRRAHPRYGGRRIGLDFRSRVGPFSGRTSWVDRPPSFGSLHRSRGSG